MYKINVFVFKHFLKLGIRSGWKRASWILSYIEDVLGGYNSISQKLPVDSTGAPLPWYTYPAIEYISQFDFSNVNIFEYGSGNSSIFWANRALRVISVESDPNWFESGRQMIVANRELLLRSEKNSYINSIRDYNKNLEVIVIDGVWRLECVKEAVKHIKSGGLLILDNSDWYPASVAYIRKRGFMQVDFIGAGPINSYAWCTSLFFQNKLDIPRLFPSGAVKVSGGLEQRGSDDSA